MKAYSPNGTEITGTLEAIRGVAIVIEFSRNKDGTIDTEYEGTTEVWWDEQKTIKRAGQAVYVDENGDEWLENELTLRDE